MAQPSSPGLPDLPSSPPTFSSPPITNSPRPRAAKPRRPPTVTPKRFNRFFNPSSSSSNSSAATRALQELTRSGVNRANRDVAADKFDRPAKRQRYYSPPDQENELFTSSPPELLAFSPYHASPITRDIPYPKPIVRRKQTWRLPETNDFYSEAADRHTFSPPSLCFCTAACNTNSLVAVGTEDGQIKILESAKDSSPTFSETYVSFSPHKNAIMDLSFSADDRWLASASGDQSAKIIDMKTQTPVYVLEQQHTSSLKQIAFQPSNDNVVATCSRDGTIALWDLRCAKGTSPSMRVRLRSSGSDEQSIDASGPQLRYPPVYKSILHGHADLSPSTPLGTQATGNRASKPPSTAAAVTALCFLPDSPHLFVTASDSSPRLRVWDIRSRLQTIRSRAQSGLQTPLPLSTSALPPSASSTKARSYGVTSLSLSTDSARLYAVSRNHTVQVYSTDHLLLGQVPSPASLSSKSQLPQTQTRMSSKAQPRTGLTGSPPLYALSAPSTLHVNSFYIRSAIRPATPLHPELLAVGSSLANITLFRTDFDRRPRTAASTGDAWKSATSGTRRFGDSSVEGQAQAQGRSYGGASALVGGHAREVTGLSWTSEGELVSCADDHVARVWREDAARALDLRAGGEAGGRRWGCGWQVRSGPAEAPSAQGGEVDGYEGSDAE